MTYLGARAGFIAHRIATEPERAIAIADSRRYHRAMLDRADASDPDLVYANYLRTCAMLGIEPTA